MNVSVNYFYWHDVMGPIEIYSNGDFKLSEEDMFFLLSTTEPFIITSESKILGPHTINKRVLVIYNRCLNNPDATDERVRLMGTDFWVIISTKTKHELVLQSQVPVIKMILDVEFGSLEEIGQLDAIVADRSTKAILTLF